MPLAVMASLLWKNYSACLALLLGKASCLLSARPLPPMLPPENYLQLSGKQQKLLTLAYFSHMMHFDDALLDLHELLKNLLNNTRGNNHGRANVEGKIQYRCTTFYRRA